MRNVWTIAWRDFKTYFTTPIAYIVIGGFLGIMGWMFFSNLYHFSLQNTFQQFGAGRGISITDGIVRPLYGNMNVVFLFLVPFITMRLISEEKKIHTLELLMTSPVTLTEIILGKFLSALLLVLVMLSLTFVYPVILFITGTNTDPGPIFASLIGTVLLTSCYLSIGVLFSAMTENQIVAGALTFAAGLFFWLISWASQFAGPVWSGLFSYLSLIGHYNNFSQGIVNSSDIVFYCSFVFIGLFLTHRVLDSQRWR
jgi:ABC-2 type transport system permease protein